MRTKDEWTRCGSIAILGRPNAGKSTLVNALVGAKIAGISKRPETTRHGILGIFTTKHAQLIFIDTPGLLAGAQKSLISIHTQKHAARAASEADLIIYLFDSTHLALTQQTPLIHTILQSKRDKTPLILALSKTDKLKKHLIRQTATKLESWICDVITLTDPLPDFGHLNHPLLSSMTPQSSQSLTSSPSLTPPVIHTVSAKNKSCIEALRAQLALQIPYGAFIFGPHTLTDRSDEFVAAEMIKEQIFRKTAEEIPYHTFVTVVISSDKTHNKILIMGTIHVTKKSHKPMMIGKQGQHLKQIREDSEKNLRHYFQVPLRLQLWVKVSPNWHKNKRHVDSIMAHNPSPLTTDND